MLSNASRDVPATSVRMHPVVAAASRGELATWAVAGAARREHMARVAGLLDVWAAALGVSHHERARWRAAGHLHDALRDERPDALRPQVPEALRDLPGPMLHGPAVAERLRLEGVTDEELLAAVAAHTTGAAGLATLGLALYAADYLEPGRDYGSDAHASLRARMPGELHEVVLAVVGERMMHALERKRAIHPGTLALWNELTGFPGTAPR
jgi:2-amino-4-hydroxy-6-hydroxymethyldihydropteridine diphosphokinase